MRNQYKDKTDFYTEVRLGYSSKAIDLITSKIDKTNAIIADVGSGSGIFSMSLLEKGHAVEPDIDLQKNQAHFFADFITLRWSMQLRKTPPCHLIA